MASTTGSGRAARHGELWGARAQDWAANEDQQTPTYEEAIRRVGIEPGQRVLDVGCGSGVFVRLVADRGARAFGVDASEALIELARKRTPDADLRVGDMQELPFDDDSFDVVTGFNSFFFADDIVAALREAGRVAKPGAPVVIQVWGPPERCDLSAMRAAIGPFLPAPEPGAPAPPQLWRPGVLEELAEQAGLTPADAFDASWAVRLPGRGRPRARDALPRARGPGDAGLRRGARTQGDPGCARPEAHARGRLPALERVALRHRPRLNAPRTMKAGPRRAGRAASDVFTDSAPAELVEEFAASMREFHPAGLRANSRAFAEADLREVLPQVSVPALLLHGDRDVRAPRNVADALHAAIPGSTLVTIPGAGHVCNVDAPERFSSEVRAFLRAAD